MVGPDVVMRRTQTAPQRRPERDLIDTSPVDQAAVQFAAFTPEPGVVDMRIPMTQRDEVLITTQIALNGCFVFADAQRVTQHLVREFMGTHYGRQQLRVARREFS